jgi:hypothetical protein
MDKILNTELVNRPPPRKVIEIGALNEDELLDKLQGYINTMCTFGQSIRNVHKELKETLENSNRIMAQYVKVLNQVRIKDATAKATAEV